MFEGQLCDFVEAGINAGLQVSALAVTRVVETTLDKFVGNVTSVNSTLAELRQTITAKLAIVDDTYQRVKRGVHKINNTLQNISAIVKQFNDTWGPTLSKLKKLKGLHDSVQKATAIGNATAWLGDAIQKAKTNIDAWVDEGKAKIGNMIKDRIKTELLEALQEACAKDSSCQAWLDNITLATDTFTEWKNDLLENVPLNVSLLNQSFHQKVQEFVKANLTEKFRMLQEANETLHRAAQEAKEKLVIVNQTIQRGLETLQDFKQDFKDD